MRHLQLIDWYSYCNYWPSSKTQKSMYMYFIFPKDLSQQKMYYDMEKKN